MKKIILMLVFTLMGGIAYAQPNDGDFKLIGAASVKESKSRDEILADIQKSLDAINHNLDMMNAKGLIKPPTVTDGLTQQPQPQTTIPATDGGPAWNYDAATRTYYRYVPNTNTQRPVTQPTAPVYYRTQPQTSAPVYYNTPSPRMYYNSPPMVNEGCPTGG